MAVLKPLKKIVTKIDLFAATQLLRFKGDAQVKTFTGGLVSLALIIYLVATFSTMIVETFNKLIINSVVDSTQAEQPTSIYLSTQDNASSFMLGLQLWSFNLTSGPRYFDITLKNSFYYLGIQTKDSVQYQLEPCTKTHWKHLSNIDVLYDRLNMKNWLCMPLNINPVVAGKFSSQLQTSLDITVKKCKNITGQRQPCAPQEQIDSLLESVGQFVFTPFFYNPLINPQSQDYLKIYLQDKNYLVFGPGFGLEFIIFNADYSINTDESILPFSEIHTENGSIVTETATRSYLMGNTSDIYCFISFQRAPESYVYNRNYQKIVDAFSYVGGLLGAFLIVLVFMNFYNQISYQLSFASSFYQSAKGEQKKLKKFNIFYYLIMFFEDLLRALKINFSSCDSAKFFSQTQSQIQKELDIINLFKKVQKLESLFFHLLTKPQLKGMMLQHQLSIQQAKKNRKSYSLKAKAKTYFKQKWKKEQQNKQLNRRQQSHLKLASENTLEMGNRKKTQIGQSVIVHQNSIIAFKNQKKLSQTTLKQTQEPQFSDNDSLNSSLSSLGEDFEEELIEDLRTLEKEAHQQVQISKLIFANLQPWVKQIYKKETKAKSCSQAALINTNQFQKEIQINEDDLYFANGGSKTPKKIAIKPKCSNSKLIEQQKEIKIEVYVEKKPNFMFLDDES